MKDDNQNKKLIEDFKKIDFSANIDKEENLKILKNKLSKIEKERDTFMNKKIRKPIAAVIAATTLLCISFTVYGQELIEMIKTITLGNYVEYSVSEPLSDDSYESIPVHESLIGKIFDKDGNALTEYPYNGTVYNEDGDEVALYFKEEVPEIVSLEEYKAFSKADLNNFIEFYDIEEGTSYFIEDVYMPSYLPEGYSFEKISYYADSLDELKSSQSANKYMSVYYNNGKNEIYSQVRFMDETTAFSSGASENIQKIKINGYDAVIDGHCLDIQIGDVIYMFSASDKKLGSDELIKIAESLI